MVLEGSIRSFILDAYRAPAEALCTLQDSSGLWHTLLNDPSSYLETSGSAGFAYGLLRGVRLGYLPKEMSVAAQKAAQAVIKQIGTDGLLRSVSYGTMISCDLDDYRRIPLRPTGYGQNLTLLMLTEWMKWSGIIGTDHSVTP